MAAAQAVQVVADVARRAHRYGAQTYGTQTYGAQTYGAPPDDEAAAELTGPEVLSALMLMRHVRAELTRWEPELIDAARQLGTSWAQLAAVLGVASRQAAERRYLRLCPAMPDAGTADQRVQAERDKRASDRAVTDWARQNSAALRQLAGQVSALDDLPAAAQQHLDLVQQALADDDAAALLLPLAGALPRLLATHPALADRISAVTERTDRIRLDTQEQRRRAGTSGTSPADRSPPSPAASG
jgi:hypothetical protein